MTKFRLVRFSLMRARINQWLIFFAAMWRIHEAMRMGMPIVDDTILEPVITPKSLMPLGNAPVPEN
jgi:hypothetical protein